MKFSNNFSKGVKFMKKFFRIILFSFLIFLTLVACGKKEENTKVDKEKITVVASNYPIYYFVSSVAGDSLNTINLVPPGVEPHDWEPGTQDMKILEEAKAFIYNGAGMEPWVKDVIGGLANKEIKTLVMEDGINLIKNEDEEKDEHHHHEHKHKEDEKDEHEEEEDEHHHHHGEFDPHIWLSLKNAVIEINNIKNFLTELLPENKDLYEKNSQEIINKITELDKKYSEELSSYKGKNIVVAHEAFAYLCRDYSLNQLGIEGVFADSEPTPTKMKEIIEFVKKNNVKVIFFESLASPKVAEVIAKETGATTDMLNPIEGLTEEDIAAGKDYLSIMQDNLEALKNALSK